MKPIVLAAAALMNVTADVQVIFNQVTRPSLEAFTIFDEGEAFVAEDRPSLALIEGGLGGKPGRDNGGNYTAWKFAKVDGPTWELRTTFELPASAEYSNSGIFFLMQDPAGPRNADSIGAQHLAAKRREEIGQAPTELEYFGYELQIIGGKPNHAIPPQNQGAAAFYGVPLATSLIELKPGTQLIEAPYSLLMGKTYEMRVVATRAQEHLLLKTFVRDVHSTEESKLVSTFLVPNSQEHEARGGLVVTLYLQAFNNNSTTSQLPIFKDLRILKFAPD